MENPLRTFIALELDATIHQLVSAYTTPLKNRFKAGFRWVRSENMHLTLKFLGQLDSGKINLISEMLTETSRHTTPITLNLAGAGVFPSWKNPRTLWIGLHPNAQLARLAAEIETGLSRFGIASDHKPFSAHLTLCRIGDFAESEPLRQLESSLLSHPVTDSAWQINEMVFFKSVLQAGGPVYTALSRHPFKGTEKV